MSELAIRVGSKEFDLTDLVGALGLPDDLAERVEEILRDPERSLDGLREVLQEALPARFGFLLSRIGELGVHELALTEIARTRTPTESIALELSAEAKVRVRQLESASGEALVGYGFVGNLRVGAAAQASSSLLGVGMDAALRQSRRMEFAVHAQRDRLALETLADLPAVLADPSNFSAVVARMKGTRLRRIQRAGTWNNTLGMTVQMNPSLSEALSAMGVNLSAVIGSSLELHYQDTAQFSLSVERSGSAYLVKLDKMRNTTTSSVLELGVDARLVGLRNGLLTTITAALPEGEEVRELLTALDGQVERLRKENLQPELARILGDRWHEAAPLFEMLLGRQTTEQFADEIQAELEEKIDDIVSANIDLLNDSATAAAQAVLAHLSRELKLSGEQKARLDDYLAEGLERGVQKLQQAFGKANVARRLLPDDTLTALLSPLKGVSQLVDRALATAASARPPLEELIGALRDVYRRYNQFRQKVIAVVRDDLEERFAVAVASEKSRSETVSRTLHLRIPEADASLPAVEELYACLWRGDLRRLADLVRALPSTVTLDGEYRRTVEHLEKSALTLHAFGLGISSSTLFSDRVVVAYDLHNRLTAATGEAEVSRHWSALTFWSDESQAIRAHWAIDYLRRPHLGNPVTVEFSIRDDSFESGDEVRRFFEPLETVGIFRPGLGEAVERTLFEGGARAVSDVVISVNVPVPWSGWTLLLEDGDIEDLLARYVALFERQATDEREITRQLYAEHDNVSLVDFLRYLGGRSSLKAWRELGNVRGRNPSPRFMTAWTVGKTVYELQTAIMTARSAWVSVNEVVAQANPLDHAVASAVAAFNDQFSEFFRGMMLRAYADDRTSVTWRVAALLAFFHGLDASGGAANPYLSCAFKTPTGPTLLLG